MTDHTCPLGEGCDLALAYMAGVHDERKRHAATGWQPIETAPKDGRYIVARGEWRGERHTLVTIILWDESLGWCGMTAEYEKIMVKYPPTMWAPIPPMFELPGDVK